MELKNTEKQEHSVVALTIEITKAELEAAKDKAFKKSGKNITVPGFRKGKAPRKMIEKRDLNPHSHYWPKDFKSFVSTIPPFEHPQKRRAENETRTRDPNLGKVMLYQLSYFRRFLENGCKDKQFLRYSQTFHRKKVK